MALTGGMLGLAAPGYGFWFLAWVGLIPAFLWLLTLNNKPSQILLGGFVFGFAYHGVYCLWLLNLYPLDWLGFNTLESLVIALGAWLLVAVNGGILISVLFWLLTDITTPSLNGGCSRVQYAFLLPLFWVFAFTLYTLNPFWIPWALLEYTQTPLGIMRDLTTLTGNSQSITLLLIGYNLLGALWIKTYPSATKRWGWLLLLPPLLLGISHDNLHPHPNTWHSPTPLAIRQGNLDIGTIRSTTQAQQAAQQAYRNPIAKTHYTPGTLLILPEEGIIPGWVSLQNPLANPDFKALSQLAKRKQIAIVTGLSTYSQITAQQFNSLALIQPQTAPQFYHKTKLVPFGEYIPLINAQTASNLLNSMGIHYQPGFSAGSKASLLTLEQVHPLSLGGLVCFELIYPDLSKRYKKQGAQLLVNSSNLGWFHGSSLMESQFLAIGQLRAAETGLPLVISANTGVSAIISPSGTVLRQTHSKQAESLHF